METLIAYALIYACWKAWTEAKTDQAAIARGRDPVYGAAGRDGQSFLGRLLGRGAAWCRSFVTSFIAAWKEGRPAAGERPTTRAGRRAARAARWAAQRAARRSAWISRPGTPGRHRGRPDPAPADGRGRGPKPDGRTDDHAPDGADDHGRPDGRTDDHRGPPTDDHAPDGVDDHDADGDRTDDHDADDQGPAGPAHPTETADAPELNTYAGDSRTRRPFSGGGDGDTVVHSADRTYLLDGTPADDDPALHVTSRLGELPVDWDYTRTWVIRTLPGDLPDFVGWDELPGGPDLARQLAAARVAEDDPEIRRLINEVCAQVHDRLGVDNVWATDRDGLYRYQDGERQRAGWDDLPADTRQTVDDLAAAQRRGDHAEAVRLGGVLAAAANATVAAAAPTAADVAPHSNGEGRPVEGAAADAGQIAEEDNHHPAPGPAESPLEKCGLCRGARVVPWQTDMRSGTVDCPECRSTGRGDVEPERADSDQIEAAIDRFGRDRFTEDELDLAQAGLCDYQTEAGAPYIRYCGRPIVPGSIYCPKHIGWDDNVDWGDVGIHDDDEDDEDDDGDHDRDDAAYEAPSLETTPAAADGADSADPQPDTTSQDLTGADPVPAPSTAADEPPPTPLASVTPLRRSARTGTTEGAQPSGPTATPVPPLAGDTQGEATVTVGSGETTNIQSTRAYYEDLAAHVEKDILGQVELSTATLSLAEMNDPEVKAAVANVSEQFALARAAALEVPKALERHRLMEEAVRSTPGAAQTGFYKES